MGRRARRRLFACAIPRTAAAAQAICPRRRRVDPTGAAPTAARASPARVSAATAASGRGSGPIVPPPADPGAAPPASASAQLRLSPRRRHHVAPRRRSSRRSRQQTRPQRRRPRLDLCRPHQRRRRGRQHPNRNSARGAVLIPRRQHAGHLNAMRRLRGRPGVETATFGSSGTGGHLPSQEHAPRDWSAARRGDRHLGLVGDLAPPA